jgi:integrase
MAKTLHRLTPRQVRGTLSHGLHHDGGGLYLQNRPHGGRSWLFRFTHDGKQHWMGLGSLEHVPLKQARDEAARCRDELRQGINPLAKRNREHTHRVISTSRAMTFSRAVEKFLAAKSPAWSNPKHAKQWVSTLNTYAAPIGNKPVSEIDTNDVMAVVSPIWLEKTETASRLRGRIEKVLDWCTVGGYRQGDNPARWRGHLKELLANPTTAKNQQHFNALPYQEAPQFISELRKRRGMAARAAEFVILTAARTNMLRGARWDEIDFNAKVWTVPAERMKGKKNRRREHRIPLCARAVEILRTLQGLHAEIVFPSTKNKPLSENAMLALLRRMKRSDLTMHGFRSTFRDWAAETTPHPSDVVEMALAHVIANKSEAAYRRGDLLEKRRLLMDDWATYLEGSTDA